VPEKRGARRNRRRPTCSGYGTVPALAKQRIDPYLIAPEG
jgi:hypothetical protein